jgi:hypothetical protein
MKVGTKSLIIGVHNIVWHPVTVFLAWCELYGIPNWKECICIFIHDWGYWGCSNMDGKEGEDHPIRGAMIAYQYLDKKQTIITYDENNIPAFLELPEVPPKDTYFYLCLFHSRGTAKRYDAEPSKLCWADKLSIKYDPWFLYLPRAILSGEIKEYRKRADDFGELKFDRTNREWYQWSHDRMIRKAYNHDTTPPYEGH